MNSAENSFTVNQFLEFLRSDIETRWDTMIPLFSDNVVCIQLLTNAILVDFGEPIVGNVNL